jgi:hypothetical protein
MNKLTVLYPHLIWTLLLLLYFMSMLVWMIISGVITIKIFYWKKGGNSIWPNYVWNMPARIWERIIFGAITSLFIFFLTFFFVPWIFSGSLHGNPSENWLEKAKQVNTAIIFGFGYEKDSNGKMTPGIANQFLLDKVMEQTHCKFLIMQEGVFTAAEKVYQGGKLTNCELIRMHPYDTTKDVNTLQAAKFAIMQMEKIGQNKAIVYAHYMQLVRAVADLRRTAALNPAWKDLEFIVPEIATTPFPKKSEQLRTRWKVVYRAIELYYSRVRDAW